MAEEHKPEDEDDVTSQPPGAGRPVGETGAPDEHPGDINADATPPISDEDQDKGRTTEPPPEDESGA
jgi:hypothetical protein